ncbi:MAG: hypothetical protein HQ556_07235 [Candidatus Marinimicrobia bacterium]|nr:hypothetical protein [Candidatus Neomarinimicrobiota bacterium]
MNRLFSILAGLLLSTTLFAQILMLEPKDNAVSKLNNISVTVAGKAGSPAKLFVNDVEVASEIIRIDGLLDFLSVRVPAGPVTLKVEAVGVGDKIFSAEKKIHVLGPVGQIKSASGDIILPADGRSIGKYKFELFDEWGYQLHDVKVVTLKLSSGTLINKDYDEHSTGHQAEGVEGSISLRIQSGNEPTERSTLDIQAAGYSQQFNVSYTIPEEPLLLVGATSGSLSTLGKGGIQMTYRILAS